MRTKPVPSIYSSGLSNKQLGERVIMRSTLNSLSKSYAARPTRGERGVSAREVQ